jgi:aspartate aminotransferase
MTAGQLPFKPMPEFTKLINSQTNFLKSYQYAPVAGVTSLREKVINYTKTSRGIEFKNETGALISNGAKHSVYNVLGALIDPGDEVILLAPYWVSYPEMVKIWGGEIQAVESHSFDGFTPKISDIQKVISEKTKAIIINSPNNPTGINYSAKWMEEFANFMMEHPNINIISDEIYYELSYFDPKPTYFYNYQPELLERTIIIDGISKAFSCTGLRIGWCVGPQKIISAINKLQGQTTSGANSLIQRALDEFDFGDLKHFLTPVREHLRHNAETLREKFRANDLAKCWYQSTSAFYFMVDFKRTPYFENKYADSQEDHSEQIAGDLLDQTGVALVPGGAFGAPNTARMSLVLEEGPFNEAMDKLTKFLADA